MAQKNEESGFMNTVLRSMQNSKAAFYLAFVGIVIQFVHNLLAVAGMFNLFASDNHILLLVGEWILAVAIGLFFAGALFYFTIKAGSIKTQGRGKGNMGEDTKQSYLSRQKKYRNTVKFFAVFDSFIDAYFWIYIVFLQGDISNLSTFNEEIATKWALLIVIIPIIIMLPQTLRLYSGEIEYSN